MGTTPLTPPVSVLTLRTQGPANPIEYAIAAATYQLSSQPADTMGIHQDAVMVRHRLAAAGRGRDGLR